MLPLLPTTTTTPAASRRITKAPWHRASVNIMCKVRQCAATIVAASEQVRLRDARMRLVQLAMDRSAPRMFQAIAETISILTSKASATTSSEPPSGKQAISFDLSHPTFHALALPEAKGQGRPSSQGLTGRQAAPSRHRLGLPLQKLPLPKSKVDFTGTCQLWTAFQSRTRPAAMRMRSWVCGRCRLAASAGTCRQTSHGFQPCTS